MNKLDRHLKALELDKVLERLAGYTACDDAREAALSLRPAKSEDEQRERMQLTFDAYTLEARHGTPSFGGMRNVAHQLRKAETGGTLSMGELLDIASLLRAVRSVAEWSQDAAEIEEMSISQYFAQLVPNKYFEELITSSILSEDEMADSASPQLADIRRKIRSASSGIKDKLDSMIHQASVVKYLQDPIVTIRDGRYVIPVKAEYKSSVSGIVHDTSASGATLFIEPMAVVEMNNQIRVLQNAEKAEIERILAGLSAQAGEFADSIISSYNSLVKLNVIFSAANLAYDMKAIRPEINNRGRIMLKRARHPLIDKERVVPVTVGLGIDYDTLVITGPNTGGKTVTLKTIGLLTVMAMCGLMIPADDESEVSFFENVLVDIGDEQSIEQSLSTFSSHMTNIINIISLSTRRSLVLLDELGAGTDPAEGAALAVSVLEYIKGVGSKTAATTHYAELKSYALDTERVGNASCEFDVNTLKPTYRLLIGVPGRSNAFAISERLGLPPEIVGHARSLISEEDKRFDRVVQALESARSEAEKEQSRAHELRRELEDMQSDYDSRRRELEKEREKIIASARDEARNIVDKAKNEAMNLLDELEELKKREAPAADMLRAARAAVKSGIGKLEDAADPVTGQISEKYTLPRALKPGDSVVIADIGKNGIVLDAPEKEKWALVQAGIMKMRVPLDNLRLTEAKNKQASPRSASRGKRAEVTKTSNMELDIRGQTVEDAILDMDRFIDSCVLSGFTTVTIIHGKGTGALRTGVTKYLRTNKHVKSFRLGTYGEGESGVTVVELK